MDIVCRFIANHDESRGSRCSDIDRCWIPTCQPSVNIKPTIISKNARVSLSRAPSLTCNSLFNDIYFTVPPFTAPFVMDPMSSSTMMIAASVFCAHAMQRRPSSRSISHTIFLFALVSPPPFAPHKTTSLPHCQSAHRNRLHKIHRSVVCKMSSFMFKRNATFRFYLLSISTKGTQETSNTFVKRTRP